MFFFVVARKLIFLCLQLLFLPTLASASTRQTKAFVCAWQMKITIRAKPFQFTLYLNFCLTIYCVAPIRCILSLENIKTICRQINNKNNNNNSVLRFFANIVHTIFKSRCYFLFSVFFNHHQQQRNHHTCVFLWIQTNIYIKIGRMH